jgi:predicted RNA-binding Zn-ribbon protein involved in translation (DUF1610 family)
MKSKKKQRKRPDTVGTRCPYCGGAIIYRSADGIYRENSRNAMLYVCSNYPACDAYVRVHAGTNIPVGSLANHELRALRNTAHRHFDLLHQSGMMSKQDAYRWLADLTSAPLSQAHIGHLGEYYCKLVIEESSRMLEQHNSRSAAGRFRLLEGGPAAS